MFWSENSFEEKWFFYTRYSVYKKDLQLRENPVSIETPFLGEFEANSPIVGWNQRKNEQASSEKQLYLHNFYVENRILRLPVLNL